MVGIWERLFGTRPPRYATPRGSGKYGLGSGVPLVEPAIVKRLADAGYVIVPVRPTAHMLESSKKHMHSWSSNLAWWSAMLEAGKCTSS